MELFRGHLGKFKYGLDITCDYRMMANFLRCDGSFVVL